MSDLSAALERHLGVKGRTLAQQVKRAGRRLPRRVRADARLLSEAEAVAGHPRLLRQLDQAQLDRALQDLTTHLAGIDRAEARRTRILSMLAGIAFNMILLFAAVVVLLRMRGAI